MPTLTHTRVFAQCTILREATVSDAEPIQLLRTTVAPFGVNVTYLYDFSTALWGLRVCVLGLPVLRDGTRGKTVRTVSFHEDDLDTAPQWVIDYVRAHHPPALPDLEGGHP